MEEKWEHMCLQVTSYRSDPGSPPPPKTTMVLVYGDGRPQADVQVQDPDASIARALQVMNRLGDQGWQLAFLQHANQNYDVYTVRSISTYWLKRQLR